MPIYLIKVWTGYFKKMLAIKKNLKDQILTDDNTIMYCPSCGGEYSANAGDYFMIGDDHKFKCCGEVMILATKQTVIKEVDN